MLKTGTIDCVRPSLSFSLSFKGLWLCVMSRWALAFVSSIMFPSLGYQTAVQFCLSSWELQGLYKVYLCEVLDFLSVAVKVFFGIWRRVSRLATRTCPWEDVNGTDFESEAGVHTFSEKKSRIHLKVDTKQIPSWGPRNIKRHHTVFCHTATWRPVCVHRWTKA
jgi:hypothetical protein